MDSAVVVHEVNCNCLGYLSLILTVKDFLINTPFGSLQFTVCDFVGIF
jgi:hypothetical protein